MNVLLVNPLIREGDNPTFPLGLGYVAAIMKKEGHNVIVLDAAAYRLKHNEILDKTRQIIKQSDIEVIGVGGIVTIYNFMKWFAKNIKKEFPNVKLIAGGSVVSSIPDLFITKTGFDVGVMSEGEPVVPGLLAGLKNNDLSNVKGIIYKDSDKIIKTELPERIKDLDSVPLPAYDLFPMDIYLKYPLILGTKKYSNARYMKMICSRGCPFRCLHGNTKINTVEGDIPVKDLVGKEIGVYTYDPKTKEVFITDAINITKTGTNKDLVRVAFDDGTFIDCTPDHRFLSFKNGNQFGPTVETIKEAKDLLPKESVRALKFHPLVQGYREVSWGRHMHKREHRVVMEYVLGRKLKRTEMVHHRDNNPTNNHPNNLVLVENHSEHAKLHPEISERMKKDNPVKYMSLERLRENGRMVKGIKRSIKTRLKLRKSKLGKKNPMWKASANKTYRSRIKEINHKVVSVKPINSADTYNLEVPSTHWFFANNVLVHNCTYCHRNFGQVYRIRTPGNIIEEMKYLNKTYDVKLFGFMDETFTVDQKHTEKFCDLLIQGKYNFEWTCLTRVDIISKELLQKMKDAGCIYANFGLETGSQVMLDTYDKLTNVETMENAIRWSKEVGFNLAYTFMIGGPGETKKTVQATIDFCKKMDIPASFFITTPYPGTRLYETLLSEGKIDDEEQFCEKLSESGDAINLNYNVSGLPDQELLDLRDWATKEIMSAYYKKHKFVLLKEKIAWFPFAFKTLKNLYHTEGLKFVLVMVKNKLLGKKTTIYKVDYKE